MTIGDLEQAIAGGDRALEHPERGAEHSHREGQHQDIAVKGGELAEAEAAVDHHVAADEQDQRQPELGKEAEHRVVEGAQPGREQVLVEDAVDRAPEAGEHVLLAGEGLDDADAGDRFLDLGGHLGDPLLDLLQRRPRDPVIARCGVDHERNRQQGQCRQRRIEHEHHCACQEDRQRVLGDEDQPVAEKEADALQVDRRSRHQLAGLLGIEEAELELLQVLVDVGAEVELDRERDLAGNHAAEEDQDQPEDPGADDRKAQRQDLGPVAALDRVDRLADQERDRYRHRHPRPSEHQREDHALSMRLEEGEQASERGHSAQNYTK